MAAGYDCLMQETLSGDRRDRETALCRLYKWRLILGRAVFLFFPLQILVILEYALHPIVVSHPFILDDSFTYPVSFISQFSSLKLRKIFPWQGCSGRGNSRKHPFTFSVLLTVFSPSRKESPCSSGNQTCLCGVWGWRELPTKRLEGRWEQSLEDLTSVVEGVWGQIHWPLGRWWEGHAHRVGACWARAGPCRSPGDAGGTRMSWTEEGVENCSDRAAGCLWGVRREE